MESVPVISQPETAADAQFVAMPLPEAARTVLISMNPRAGARFRHDRIRMVEKALSAAGYDVHVTTDLAELTKCATRWHDEQRLRLVVAIGGDGTASLVRNHVPLDVPLMPLPMGTENLLGRHAAQPADPAGVCRTVDEGVAVGLDLGRANGKYFLLMISAGFDAEVVRSLHENRRGNIRRSAYLLPAIEVLRNYRYPEMRLYAENGPNGHGPQHCRWLFGFNLPLYALGLPIAPEAVATDGLLDVCEFERGTAWSVMRYLWHIRRGRHLTLSDTRLSRVRRFRLEPAEAANIPYQLDGDHSGVLPVDVDVVPGALRLVVSRETAARWGFAVNATPHAVIAEG